MKKIILIFLAALAITSCNQDKSKEKNPVSTVPQGLVSTQSNAIRVPYDSAYVEVCDTAHFAVAYDSVFTYIGRDSCYEKIARFGKRLVCRKTVMTGHKIAYLDSLDITCKTDTLKGYRDSIPSADLAMFGGWGNGDGVTQRNIDALKSQIKGWNVRISWKDFQPTDTGYNWKWIDNMFDLLVSNKLQIGFMIYVGDNSPPWIYKAPYNVPQVVTSTGQIFPFYKNDTYQKHVKKMWQDVATHLKNKGYSITFWMSAEGSTGDEGAQYQGYKGTPKDAQYAITADWWTNYRRTTWLFLDSISSFRLMVNTGNNDRFNDNAWAVQNIPGVWLKYGKPGHQFITDDEIFQVQRNLQFTSNDNANRSRTELENVDVQDTSYNDACATQQMFFALANNVDIFCISAVRASYLNGLKYFNLFAGKRYIPATTYSFSYSSCAQQTTATIVRKGFWWDDKGNNVLTGNYERGIHFSGTSDSLARVATGTFGRFARIYKNATFSLDTKLLQPSEIDVVYMDKAGTININGTVINCKGTNQQLSAVVKLTTRSFKITTTTIPVFLVYTK